MYVTVTVLKNLRVALPWTMFNTSPDHTFAKLFEEVQPRMGSTSTEPGSARVSCCLSSGKESSPSQRVSVDLSFNVVECCTLNGRFVRFDVAVHQEPSDNPPRNAYTVMMMAAKELKFPSKVFSTPERYEIGRGDHRLHDDVVDFLRNKGLGFSPGAENTTGKQVVKSVSDALFYIQPHLKTFNGRIPAFIPSYFSCLLDQIYNDPQSHKHALSPIKREMLQKISGPLFTLMLLPLMKTARWKAFAAAVEALAKNIDMYMEYLQQQTIRMREAHRSPTPVRCCGDGTSSHIKFVIGAGIRRPSIIARYKYLEEQLTPKKVYEGPVFLNDFAPPNPRLKYTYIHELSLPFRIELYSYHYGNNLGSLFYAWKVPADPADYDPGKSQNIISNIEKNIKQYHSREMRRQFIARFGLVLNTKASVMNELYQFLTNDSAVTSISDVVQQKLKFLLDSQDPEVVYDLRDTNPGRPEMFEPFWCAVESLINDKALAAVDSRRHGTVCHFALAYSVRDLRDQVLEKHPDLEVPSLEWIRAQFWPRNPFQKAAAKHTGRLQLKHMVQSRQLHADHMDAHYAAAIFKYQKKFAVMFREHVAMVCLDDKHNIKIGEPGFPVAAVDRGKEVVVGLNSSFQVGDHDFTKAKATPSVTLICDVPASLEETFYRGSVKVCYKDTIFQPSSPYRHVAELHKVLLGNESPILCVYTDGGPDHRTTYLTVQISLICLFLSLNLDMLVAARTAPQNSYRNPVERIMSVLNLGLQSIGLMRLEMSEEFEKLIKNCNSMEDVRNAAAKKSGFQDAFTDSMQPPLSMLAEVTNRLKLKDKSFETCIPCTKEEIEQLWEQVHEIDPTVERTDSKQAQLKSRTRLNAFMEHCCIRRKYVFSIKKCGEPSCQLCKPPRLPLDVFKKLKAFPDPMKKVGSDRYEDFNDIYGKPTTEKYLPSVSQQKLKEKPKKPFRMTAETVCSIMICGECLKPRCFYSSRKLSRSEQIELHQCKEDYLYTCGGTVIPDDHSLFSVCSSEIIQNCEEPVSPHYFSCRLQCVLCCYSCGAFADLVPIPDEMKKGFQSVHPICTECKAQGKKERTRGPKYAGRKRSASQANL